MDVMKKSDTLKAAESNTTSFNFLTEIQMTSL